MSEGIDFYQSMPDESVLFESEDILVTKHNNEIIISFASEKNVQIFSEVFYFAMMPILRGMLTGKEIERE